MKKLLFVLAIGAFAACNDSTTEIESTNDTTVVAPAPDATVMPDTTVVVPADSTMKADSTAK